jgi:hypothetical protein
MEQVQEANPVAQAIDSLDGDTAVAKRAGLKTSWAVSKWRKNLPPDRVLWLAEQTGWKYTPHMLAPNLYPNPTDGLPKSKRKSAEPTEKVSA